MYQSCMDSLRLDSSLFARTMVLGRPKALSWTERFLRHFPEQVVAVFLTRFVVRLLIHALFSKLVTSTSFGGFMKGGDSIGGSNSCS
jgi:hypothetical protein